MPDRVSHEALFRGKDRRLVPRYHCCGSAQITCIPYEGPLLAGRLRNIGWGGCYIETGHPFLVGSRTEVLLRANALCFRAMAQIRAVRDRLGVGLEFIRLSTGGYRSLAEVLVELEQQQPLLRQPVYPSTLESQLAHLSAHRVPGQCLANVVNSVSQTALVLAPSTVSRAIQKTQPEVVGNGSLVNLFG